jgi:hypothetical protein
MVKFVSDFVSEVCRWFSPGPPVSSTNKTDCHDIAEILLKVVLTPLNKQTNKQGNKPISNRKSLKEEQSIFLGHNYMTTHSPCSVQALQYKVAGINMINTGTD